MEVFGTYAGELSDISDETLKNIVDNKEWNAFDTLWKTAATPGKFALALVAKGVIPSSAIATTLYDGARGSIGMYLKSPYTLVSNGFNGPSAVLHDF